MRVPGKSLLLPVAVLVIAPSVSFAQNNTAATASNIVMGQGSIETNTSAAPNDARWYRIHVVTGRSYCAEVWPTANNPTSTANDFTVEVFRTNGTTLITSNDDYTAEPSYGGGFGPSRACWIAQLADGSDLRLRARNFGTGVGIPFQVRVVDTTLHCPFWVTDTASNFDAFIQYRNNSGNASAQVVITAYNATGAQQGTPFTITLPANDNGANQLSAAPFLAPVGSGSIAVAYASGCAAGVGNNTCAQGGPGTVSANLTSISFSAGVGFDVACTTRQDWIR